jgi:endonuclease YncB( thermonuclease family)
LEDDVERHDIFGRRLASVYLRGRLFEDTLLTRGYARLLVIEPNHAHARTMLDEELDAQAARVGLWGACDDSVGSARATASSTRTRGRSGSAVLAGHVPIRPVRDPSC